MKVASNAYTYMVSRRDITKLFKLFSLSMEGESCSLRLIRQRQMLNLPIIKWRAKVIMFSLNIETAVTRNNPPDQMDTKKMLQCPLPFLFPHNLNDTKA